MKSLHCVYKTAVVSAVIGTLFLTTVQAQINLPFQLCSGLPVTVSTNIPANAYLWVFDSAPIDFNLRSLPASSPVLPDLGIKPAGAAMVADNGQWYTFITSQSGNTLLRLDYGNSPLNTPVKTTVGSYGTDNQLQGIDIIKDNSAQSWYGFAVNGTQLIRLAFGSSLTNTPTATTINLSTQLAAPHQISLQKFGTTWVGFIANRDGAITRLVFNGGLAQTPTVYNLPINNYYSPSYFALHQQNGNWYMLVCNYTSGAISRVNFGTNIQQNNPTVADLGNFGVINHPRSINLFTDCNDNQLLAYVVNENGQLIRLNYNGDITSAPSAGTVGNYSNGSGTINMFLFNHTIYGLRNVPQINTTHLASFFTLPASAVISYTPVATYAYNSPGAYKIRLFTNAGQVTGSNAYCQNVTVDDCNPNSVPTLSTEQYSLSQNYPNPATRHTAIDYYLQSPVEPSLVIKDVHGRTIRQYDLTRSGKGTILLDTEQLSNGLYFFTLINNGLLVATKKMMVQR